MRPLDLLNLNVNRPVTIIVKRNQRYLGILTGFDEHLNLFIEKARSEKVVQENSEDNEPAGTDDEDDIRLDSPDQKLGTQEDEEAEKPLPPVVKVEEEVGNIVLRGDNIIFLKFDKPNFGKPPFQGQDRNKGYQRGGYQGSGYNRDYPPRQDSGDRGYRGRSQGYNRGDRGSRGGDSRYGDRDQRPRGPPPPRGNQRNDRDRTPRDKD